jgi:hypothetical protein
MKPFNSEVLTPNAFKFWIRHIPQGNKYRLTDEDWNSIFLFEELRKQREAIVNKIISQIQSKAA